MKKIYVIGLGPGGYQYMTEQAKLAIEALGEDFNTVITYHSFYLFIYIYLQQSKHLQIIVGSFLPFLLTMV